MSVVSLPTDATPAAVRASFLAEIDESVSCGALDAWSAEALRAVLLPFVELFSQRRQAGESGGRQAMMTETVVAAVIVHLFLNTTQQAYPTEAVLDTLLALVRDRVMRARHAGIGTPAGGVQ